jgi:hypothetical protein
MATQACVPEPFLVCIDCFVPEVIPEVFETWSPNAIVTTTLYLILTNLRSYANIWVYLWQPAQENTVLSPKPTLFGHLAIIKYHPVVSRRVNTR